MVFGPIQPTLTQRIGVVRAGVSLSIGGTFEL
jgi:hypothetical protein